MIITATILLPWLVQYRLAVSGAVTSFTSAAKLQSLIPAVFHVTELIPDSLYVPSVPSLLPAPLSTSPYGTVTE
jgi:hypothetical protein